MIDLPRENTKLAISTLAAICKDESAPASARVSAASHLLDRAWGRPRQTMEVFDADREWRSLKIEFVKPADRSETT